MLTRQEGVTFLYGLTKLPLLSLSTPLFFLIPFFLSLLHLFSAVRAACSAVAPGVRVVYSATAVALGARVATAVAPGSRAACSTMAAAPGPSRHGQECGDCGRRLESPRRREEHGGLHRRSLTVVAGSGGLLLGWR